VASLALYAALASGMHRPCSVGSSPSLRRSTPLLVQTWPPRDDDIHPNEAPGTGQPRAKVGASFGPLRGRRMPRRELARVRAGCTPAALRSSWEEAAFTSQADR